MTMSSPAAEDYFMQKPHYNLFNKFIYSDFMKKYNPFLELRSYHPLIQTRMAPWYGRVPQATWVDGILDYSYNKHNYKTIGHFDMHENRKNKPFKQQDGGDKTHGSRIPPVRPGYRYIYYPKGCREEISKYKSCVSNHRDEECVNQKINVMEICPKWALELLRERKRVLLRATLIDNETYRRAMSVSPYNQGRSLSDIKVEKKWSSGHVQNLRSDGYWADDRYNPTVYPSPDQNTNINLGNKIIFNDLIGGNRIEIVNNERQEYINNSYHKLKNIRDSSSE
jgi:hypothetical protein